MRKEETISHLREVKISCAGMPRHCSAGGCKSRDNHETRNAGVTFHKLPKGANRRNLWITNSHRTDSWDPQTDFVYFCSKHFTLESFELTGCSGIRRLKEDAFPTVFNFSSATKCKTAEKAEKQEDVPDRTSSDEQERTQQETNRDQTAEDTRGQRSAAAAEETNENTVGSSPKPSVTEQHSEQEHSPSAAEPLPVSPSRYMRRLPPPLGSYLLKEHSYAQHCPLLWRRRYDQAVDSLEKALRQLHAARRRENRLRSTVLRLRDKRLKHTLLVSQDGGTTGGTPAGERRQGRGGSDPEDAETVAQSENAGLFEDRCADQMELGCSFLPHSSSWSEEENGFCFYCGRGPRRSGRQAAGRVSKTQRDVQPSEHHDSLKIQTRVRTSAEKANDLQRVRLERPPEKHVETNDTDGTNLRVLLQHPSVQHVIPAAASQPETLPFVVPQQKLLLSDGCEREREGPEQRRDLQQQLFWIQDGAEGQVILVPVPAEDGLQSCLKMEGGCDEGQTILMSQLDLQGGVGHMTENGGRLARTEAACDEEHIHHHSVLNSTSGEMREDVREKLKEHLEGFHLQLRTEFTN
ncbi:THAP domain-containing protein 7 [Brachyistius frenatus]|uniref:THAP domain-containing protein 7 n=1 Tax=Brachyistius frenatus TaxID=100188 RepID=UPI0037E73663